MRFSIASLSRKAVSLAGCTAILAVSAVAQKPEARILAAVDNDTRTTLVGTHPPRAHAEEDAGRMPGSTPIQNASVYFSRSAAQQAAMDALTAAQQDPSSPSYRKWLSPDEFGTMFGASDADIAQVETWLAAQGLKVEGVSRNRSVVSFSGTVAQIEAAFTTEMHYFKNGGETNFAPASDLSIPAAFAPAVLSVGELSSFKPKSNMKAIPNNGKADFTSSQSGNHFVQPGDVATIYDINAAYSAGYTGIGQSIAVVGQSGVVTADITNFQNAAGTPVRLPTMVLVPNSGVSTIYQGDEGESHLDLEYTGAIAKAATIYFVYTGNAANTGGAFGALIYAIQNKIAPIISVSYSDCETDLGSAGFAQLNPYLQQAAMQGQSVIVAAGDSGSTGCNNSFYTSLTLAQRQAVSAEFPSSSQFATALGGTEYLAANVAAGNTTYWTPAPNSSTDVLSSAKSYIPEMVWNDDSTGGLSSGGGGISQFTPRPTWQTGVPGITAGSFRLLPDVSIAASPNNAGYLICTSDPGSTSVVGSCSHGFRDINTASLTIIGGTSVSAPIFAGMLALINQKAAPNGQGVINPTLYSLASNATTYASAFHDITIGSNACLAGPSFCSGSATTLYQSGVGYDSASGLGSVDLFNLLSAWPVAATLVGSSTTVTATTLTPAAGAGDTITFTVASASSGTTTVPTGSINLSIDGAFVQSIALVAGSATYTFSSSLTGAHVLSAVYSGDSVFSTSTGTVTLTVVASTLLSTATTVAAAVTPALSGTADALTITVTGATPVPTGTVSVSVDGGAATVVTLTPGTTASTATFAFTSTTLGSHMVAVAYSGNTVYKTSTATLPLTVKSPGSYTLSAPALSVSAGSTTAETITVTPTGGYVGPTTLTLTTVAPLVNACYTLTSPTISGTAPVPVTATIYTDATTCPGGAIALKRTGGTGHAEVPIQRAPGSRVPLGFALAGLLAVGYAGRRTRRLRGLIVIALLAAAGFGLSGCGSGGTTGAGIPTSAVKGVYTVTVSGTDVASGTTNATTTFTLTIQ